MITNILGWLLFILCNSALVLSENVSPLLDQPNYTLSEEWINIQRVHLYDYTNDFGKAMEPFISRDGKYLFWNSINRGNNTSLHYGILVNTTAVKYIGPLGGQANGPIPHLDAVASMDKNNIFYWVSTRNYPQVIENLQTGTFDPALGSIPLAQPVLGDIYIKDPGWIVMDQEVNRDGSLMFYVNAQFTNPPGLIPIFSNISLAVRNTDGTFSKHPDAVEIMRTVNNVVDPTHLRYGPSSLGTDGLELYFTTRVMESVVSGIFYAKRDTRDSAFGIPERIVIPEMNPPTRYIEPEAPTLSDDGNILMFNRIDCPDKYCQYINVYSLERKVESQK